MPQPNAAGDGLAPIPASSLRMASAPILTHPSASPINDATVHHPGRPRQRVLGRNLLEPDDVLGRRTRRGAEVRSVQIIVPAATKGVNIVRGIGIWGRSESDHCEVRYEDVRVPVSNALGEVGQGHQAAQDRLGPGRIFHCMNPVGQMWRAFDLMVERAKSREVHGGLPQDKQFVQGFIADSYIDIQAARLMTIHAAEKIDQGLDAARTDISAIKVFVPAAYSRVVDRAIQVWGAAGVSNDLPLAGMFQGARTLRIADGPDEVHKILIAKNVLGQAAINCGWDFGN